MNDTTMPPPSKGSSSSPASSGSARSKVALRKGFGLSDWTRLVQKSNDLAQRKGQPLRRIKWKEIAQHDSIYDGWMVIRGKVYFISPYIAYHPGGESILKKILGKDATKEYDKHHRWVNEDGYVCWKSAIPFSSRTLFLTLFI
jgi:cytochrome b involved in lipid metabolism